MKRREFLAVAALYGSGAAQTQGADLPLRIALLRAPKLAESVREFQAFRDGLREGGLREGRDIVLEIRSAEGLPAALPRLAEELARSHPAVFVVGGTVAAHAARAAAPNVPVVALIGDFSTAGWASEFARPRAGVTGVSFESNSLDPKRMELLSEVLPRRSAILNLGDGSARNVSEPALQSAAIALGLTAHTVDARTTREIETAFDSARKLGVAGINVLSSPFLNANRRKIIELAADSKLPAIYQWPEAAEDGGFMAYGPRLSAMYRQMAGMVAKIVRGAQPQDVPVEQPTRLDLVINMKTAKSLGITVPQALLLRADVV